MTNEEAVKELMMAYEDLKNMCYMDCGRAAAFNKAREALKAEPCEDAISRQAMLDGLASIAKVKAKSDAQYSLMGRVMFFTEQLPPVAPKSRTGHWVGIDEEPSEAWECDRCGFVVDAEGCIDPVEYRDMYKYCPNCGAEMEREGE